MATITMPDVPDMGVPEGEKDAGQRVDFKPTKFDLLIESKGYLLAWTRASVCPCKVDGADSDQPDPNCSLCEGKGWFYFGANTEQDISAYNLDTIQKKIIDDSGAMLIRGVLTGIATQPDTTDRLTNWVAGTMSLTVRSQNELGLYDRITVLNPEIVYSENLIADGTEFLSARYLITGVNQIRSFSYSTGTVTELQFDSDYTIMNDGRIQWGAGKEPSAGTRISIHYLCHPTFLVMEHPHIVRNTLRKFKKDPATLQTPLGDPDPLPIQALVKYEFLP